MLTPHTSQNPPSPGDHNLHGDRAGAWSPSPSGQRVLVVDDEPLVRDALGALVQAFGYQVECCADGPSAIATLQDRADLGLVILDLILPGMDGRAIFHAMRALRPGLRFLISSGYADGEECQVLMAEGATGILAKPFRAQHLARTLEALLGPPVPR